MAARLALRKRGNRTGKRLAEVYAAGLFLYGCEDIGIKMDDLFDEPLAVNIAQPREAANEEFLGIGYYEPVGFTCRQKSTRLEFLPQKAEDEAHNRANCQSADHPIDNEVQPIRRWSGQSAEDQVD